MSNLLKLATEVSDLMAQINDMEATQQRLRALRTRAMKFNQLREKAEDLGKKRTVLRAGGVQLNSPLKATRKLVGRSKKFSEDFQRDWEATLHDRRLNDTFIEPTAEHLNKAETELKRAWRAHVDQEGPQIKSDWLAHLPEAIFGDAKQSLRKIQEDLSLLRQTLPEDEEAATRPVRLKEQVAPIFSQLENTPEPVRAFLNKATHKGAGLEDFTDDVRRWLDNNSMLDQIRIHIG